MIVFATKKTQLINSQSFSKTPLLTASYSIHIGSSVFITLQHVGGDRDERCVDVGWVWWPAALFAATRQTQCTVIISQSNISGSLSIVLTTFVILWYWKSGRMQYADELSDIITG